MNKENQPKRRGFPLIFFIFALFNYFFLTFIFALQPRPKSEILIKPDPMKIEQELFALLNEEREKNGLPRLRWSSLLTQLARQHSQDMIAQKKLTHFSLKGESYVDRLVRENFFFIQAGENVARSETFSSFWIHQSMMESQEHRENILHPKFDEVGLGVAEDGNGIYFITQDFLQSLSIMTSEEARNRVFSYIEDFRQAKRLPPMSLDKEATEVAQQCAQSRAKNEPPPPLPKALGEVLMLNLTTPFLDDLAALEMHLIEPRYRLLGIGVSFNREPNHPGGAYFLTLILMPDLFEDTPPIDSMRNIIWTSINEIRFASGLNYLRLRSNLCIEAERIGAIYLNRKDRQAASIELSPNHIAVFYLTEKLELFPEEIKPWLRHPFGQNLGIHVILTKTEDFPRGAYFVILVFE